MSINKIRKVTSRTKALSLLLLFGLGTFLSPLGFSQGIFAHLDFEETYIRAKLEQYAISVDSITSAPAMPENIYYRLVFREILADPTLYSELPPEDLTIVERLPAHEDRQFVIKDQEELAAMCLALTDDGSAMSVVSAANAFDASRIRREQDLDTHYAGVVNALSVAGKDLVLKLFLEFSQSKNITYNTFSMSGLAADEPDLAHAILLSGCDNFIVQAETPPQRLTLKDQLYALPSPVGN